jgi:hypothetical protein
MKLFIMQFYLLNLSGEHKNAVNTIEILLKSSKETELFAHSLSCPFSGNTM